jgi:cell division protein ZapA
MSIANHLDVILFGREYRLACPPEQQAALQAAVSLVNAKMQEVASKGRQVSTERAAIMAALTLAHDLLESQKSGIAAPSTNVDTSEAKRKVEHMVQRADAAIETHQHALF